MDTIAVVEHMRWQSKWCTHLGSPLTSAVVDALGRDILAGGPVADVLVDWIQDPQASALALRLAGALHVLVRRGDAPDLTPFYTVPNHEIDRERIDIGVRSCVVAHADWIGTFIERPVQTNELGRSSCLLGGFLEIARQSGMPLRLMEIGASGGLNLLWDAFHYSLAGTPWGPKASPIQLHIKWRGPLPALDMPIRIESRQGCDINPLDLSQDDDLERALSYIWADQPERRARFEAGAMLARQHGIQVDEADAAQWLKNGTASASADGVARVLFHSIMWQYMPIDTQKICRQIIEDIGAASTSAAPFFWLRMEPPRPDAVPELLLTSWPGGTVRHLAWCHPHGVDIEWAA